MKHRKRYTGSRNKSWKKKSLAFKYKFKKLETKQKSTLHEKLRGSIKPLNERRKQSRNFQMNDIQKALRRSKTLASLKAQVNRLHEARLDQLLAANERKQMDMCQLKSQSTDRYPVRISNYRFTSLRKTSVLCAPNTLVINQKAH